MSETSLGSFPSFSTSDITEEGQYLKTLLRFETSPRSFPWLEGPVRRKMSEMSPRPSLLSTALAKRWAWTITPESHSDEDEREHGTGKRQRRTYYPPDEKGKGLERPYNLYARTDSTNSRIQSPPIAQAPEDSKRVSRTVIDLTSLDDPPVGLNAQDIAGPSTGQPAETLTRSLPPVIQPPT